MNLPRLALLASFPVLALLLVASCSGAGGVDTGGKTGAAGGAGEAGAAGGGNGACDVCLGTQYTPCDAQGKPGTPITCESGVCLAGVGCAGCAPGTDVCVGDGEVRKCPESGDASKGELVQACNTIGGEKCKFGVCSQGCDLAAGQPSNIGCEFWAVDLDQQDGFNDPASAPWGLVVSNAGQAIAKVKVEYNDAAYGQPQKVKLVGTVDIPPGQLVTLTLPTRELDCGVKPNDYASPGTCLSSNAFRVVSSSPVVVYQFNVFTNTYSNDASLLLPTNALGKFHRIIGWGAGHPVDTGIPFPGVGNIIDRSYITVVGVYPDTKVMVKPTARIKGNPPIALTQPGQPIEVTLGPFDVLNLETDTLTLQEAMAIKGELADLTGSLVTSSKPVAVFSGVESTGAPGKVDIPKYPGWTDDLTCCLDHLEEQMFPLESIGKKFVITRSPIRSTSSYAEPDVLRFVGAAATAQVKTNLPPPFDNFTIAPGEVKDTWTDRDIVVESSEPVLIGQVLISNNYVDGPFIGDPSLTVFPPIDQYRNEYVLPVPPSWDKNYVVVSAKPSAKAILDGTPTSSCKVTEAGQINGVTYESRRCPVQAGAHYLTSDEPVGVVVYGYGSAGSYAYAGGADVKKIYEVPDIN